MQKEKKTNNHSDFIIGMEAFYPNTTVKDGVQLKEGDHAGGFSQPFKGTEEEVRKAANEMWNTEWPGHYKQMWIKKDGITIAFHGNYAARLSKKGLTRKVNSKK